MMAKTSTGTGKEPSGDDDRYEPEPADRPVKDPADELRTKQQDMADLRAKEKSLQDQIARLTAHIAATSTLSAQFADAQVAELTASRQELTKFVSSGMKALDPGLKSAIEKIRNATDETIKSAGDVHEAALDELKQKQAALLKRQEGVATAVATYNASKEAMTRAKRVATDLGTLRAKVEVNVKANQFSDAGFWLLELDQLLSDKQNQIPKKDEAMAALSAAERGVEQAHAEAAKAESAVARAKAHEAEMKKSSDDAVAHRIGTILGALAAVKATAA
jgi:hypothetical protein